jgi:hypothetical protein
MVVERGATALVMGWPDQGGMLVRRLGMALIRVALAWCVHLAMRRLASVRLPIPASLFQRIHRSTIVRRDLIDGLRHQGSGVWCVVRSDGEPSASAAAFSMTCAEHKFRDLKPIAGQSLRRPR